MVTIEYLNSYNEPYKFNGKELDDETGNYYYYYYYYGARYYDPKWSVWLSVDPMAEKYPGWSPYNYTLNNPIKYVDPNGLTDYKLNKKTGDVKQVGEANEQPDRVLKTDNDGNIQRKGEGIGISFGYAEDATGNGGLYFIFSGNIGLDGDLGLDLGKALPSDKNSSVLIGDLRGTEYSHNLSIGPLGGGVGGMVQSNVKGLGLMNFDNYGKNYNGYQYGKGGLSSFSSNYLQEPGLGYMFSKDKTWVWDF